MFAHLNPHSPDFGDICALHSPFLHQLTVQSSLFEPGHLQPCPSYGRRRDGINLGLLRSLYKGGGGYYTQRPQSVHSIYKPCTVSTPGSRIAPPLFCGACHMPPAVRGAAQPPGPPLRVCPHRSRRVVVVLTATLAVKTEHDRSTLQWHGGAVPRMSCVASAHGSAFPRRAPPFKGRVEGSRTPVPRTWASQACPR